MNRLLTTVLCSLVTIGTVIQADPSRPKLVVGIVVDQLRTDYIEYLRDLFGEDGFNRLIKEGAYLRNVDFGVPGVDRASATALLYTGAPPSRNGVAGETFYDPSTLKTSRMLAEPSGVCTPAQLRLTTISDEIALDGSGSALIYSLGADAQQAVIMAGHSGTAAYWLNPNSGKWSTSSYYKDNVSLMADHSGRHGVDARIDTMQWRPALPADKYKDLPAAKAEYPFRHMFSRSDREIFNRFTETPLANRELTDLAIDYIERLKLGQRGGGVDMLNIAYTAAPYSHTRDGDARFELQDTYLRLDSDLSRLMTAIDNSVGLDNTLIYVASTGYATPPLRPAGEGLRLPGGRFSAKRAVSLLNAYLSARYGNGDYVKGYHDGHFYLSEGDALTGRISRSEMATEAALFLAKMAGIADAYTQMSILTAGEGDASRMRDAVDFKTAGDVIVTFMPGWTVTDDTVYPETEKTYDSTAVATPAFLLGGGVEPTTISTPVDAAAIAPTVTQILRIRSPNGARCRPLFLSNPQK